MKVYDIVAYAGGAVFACAILFNLGGLLDASQMMRLGDIIFLVVDALFLGIAWRRGEKAIVVVSVVALAGSLWMLFL